MRERIILDLCGGTGSWSEPYRKAGYDVRLVTLPDYDVREYEPPKKVWGILAAPPCTEFAGSGARWWLLKDPSLLKEAIDIVLSCLQIIIKSGCRWWALENPVGRLARCVPELGRWAYTFQPWEYGDPYTKRTCVWGKHSRPMKNIVAPTEGGKIWRMPPSPDRAVKRSITPQGFAEAFYKANP